MYITRFCPAARCFEFKSLTTDDIRTGLRSAAARLGAEDKSPVLIPDDALEYLAQSAGGDMRKALGNLEFCRHRCTRRKRLPHDHTGHGAAGRRAHGHAV